MTTMLSAPGRTRIGGESQFLEAAVTLLPLKCLIDISGLTTEVLRDEHVRQGDYETAKIVGAATGSIELKFQLHGYSSGLPSGAPSIHGPTGMGATSFDVLAALVGNAFGGLYAGGYRTGVTLSDPAANTLGTTDASTFTPGMPLAYATGYEKFPYDVQWATEITEGTPDVISLLSNRNFAPSGTKLFGGITAFVRDLDPMLEALSFVSFTLEHQFHNSSDLLLARGCQVTALKISGEAGKVPMLTITLGVAHWQITTDGAWPVDPITYSYPQPTMAANWRVNYAGSSLAIKSFEFDLGLTRSPIPDGSYAGGIGGWIAATRRPTVAMQVFRGAMGEIDTFAGQIAYPLQIAWGVGAGKLFGLCLPAARIVELPKPSDRDGAVVSDIKLEAHYYGGDDDTSTTTPANSPARFAWL